MKKRMLAALMITSLLIGSVTMAQATGFKNPDDTIAAIPAEYTEEAAHQGKVERIEYDTPAYNGSGDMQRKYAYVYTPYGYDENSRYDVLYLMHGGGGSQESVFTGTEHPGMIKNMLDHLIEDKQLAPILVVAPSFYPADGADSSVSTAEGLVKLFPDEFVNDLIPAVEGTYSTYAETTDEEDIRASRDHRAFGGFSMGSVTTWYVFQHKLDYVATFLPISGDSWAVAMQGGRSRPQETAETLRDALAQSGYGVQDFFIYAITGTDDIAEPCMTPMIEKMQAMPETFIFAENRADGNIRYRVKPGGMHDMTNVRQYLYNMLPKLWPAKEE